MVSGEDFGVLSSITNPILQVRILSPKITRYDYSYDTNTSHRASI